MLEMKELRMFVKTVFLERFLWRSHHKGVNKTAFEAGTDIVTRLALSDATCILLFPSVHDSRPTCYSFL